jgi:hypothetical protein
MPTPYLHKNQPSKSRTVPKEVFHYARWVANQLGVKQHVIWMNVAPYFFVTSSTSNPTEEILQTVYPYAESGHVKH